MIIAERNVDTWTIRPRPNPRATLRLFCFPYAGGGASIYRNWLMHLPPAVEGCLVQLPGRENRLVERPFRELSRLLPPLGQALYPYLDKPFAFFGHSMGALVSFELARYLRKQYKLAPVRLFVSAYRGPRLPARDTPIHHLPEPEFIAALRGLNGTPEAVLHNAELMQLVRPTLRADFTLCETYEYLPDEPLTCPISAFGGLQDPDVSREQLALWRDETCGAFILRMFPGDHFFLHNSSLLLLRALCQDLAQLIPHGRGCYP